MANCTLISVYSASSVTVTYYFRHLTSSKSAPASTSVEDGTLLAKNRRGRGRQRGWSARFRSADDYDGVSIGKRYPHGTQSW